MIINYKSKESFNIGNFLVAISECRPLYKIDNNIYRFQKIN